MVSPEQWEHYFGIPPPRVVIIFYQFLDWLTESQGVQAMLLADLETCAMSRGVVFQHDLPILP